VLETAPAVEKATQIAGSDRRLMLPAAPRPALASLRWPSRPSLPGGNPAWTYMVDVPERHEAFAIFIGHTEQQGPFPFEVWVNGSEQPRALGAVAKTLSMDMRALDRRWLSRKLDALEQLSGDDGFVLAMPPTGHEIRVPSLVSGFARLIRYRCTELGALPASASTESPLAAALISEAEPQTGHDGTLSWAVDIVNPATGDDISMFLKELQLPDGQRRPYAAHLAGRCPRVLDGLCKLLSLDMRVVDVGWIGMKLRKLLTYSEVGGAFFARVPGEQGGQLYASTVAYMARLIIYRYQQLGLLDVEGRPLKDDGILALPSSAKVRAPLAGRQCPDCHAMSVVRQGGCDRCDACGWQGSCG